MRLLPKALIAATVATTAALTMTGTSAKAASLSNGIYQVNINDSTSSTGSWNAITGPSHPVGPNKDILYTGTITDTNFSSLRIFGSSGNTDYTFANHGGATSLDSFVTAKGSSPLAPAGQGYRTTWNVTPQNLNITQDLLLTGTTYNNSAVYHTVNLTNTGTSAITIGWRNLYDWEVTNSIGTQDDGPNNQVEKSNGSVLVPATTNEFSYTPTTEDLVRVSTSKFAPTYQPLLGLGYDPKFIPTLSTTAPDQYEYASWPSAYNTSYDYTVNPTRNVSNDSAGLSYFKRTIAPGSSVRFTESIFASIPGAIVPGGPTGGPTAAGVPEPSATWGLLAFFGLAARFLWKRPQQQ